MGLITKEVEIQLHPQGIKWYEDKGYIIKRVIDKQGRLVVPRHTMLTVYVKDLPNKSNAEVNVICDYCAETHSLKWVSYLKSIKKYGKYCCGSCVHKLFTGESARISQLKNGISFNQWCINNKRQDILNRWDYELNEYKPDEISYGSAKKCWFKCPSGIHKSELNKISNITSGKHIYYNLICNSCNSIGQWLINNYGEDALNTYWSGKNIVNPFEISYGNSHKKVWLICPNCGEEKEIYPNKFTFYGFGCLNCSDGVSYGEKFMYSTLQQLNLNFEQQLSKRTFKWCANYRYDFFVQNCIIETHGIQHYEESPRGKSLEEEQINDINKKDLAILNHILEQNYIVIDCRYSNLDWIKNNILESRMSNMFDLSCIDWLKCHEYACCSLVKVACDYWNNGIKSTQKIANILKLSKVTIIKYLKQGTLLGWCNYDAMRGREIGVENTIKAISKKVEVFKDGISLGTFDSITELSRKSDELFGVHLLKSGISNVCCHREEMYKGFIFKHV